LATGKKPLPDECRYHAGRRVAPEAGPAGKLNPILPSELEGIIGKAMEKDREKAL